MKILKSMGYTFAAIDLILGAGAAYIAMSTKLLSTSLCLALAAVIILLVGIGFFLATKKSRKTRVASIIYGIVVAILLCIGMYYLYHTYKALDSVTENNVEVEEINVYVSKDDEVNSIDEALDNNYSFATIATDNQKYLEETISDIEAAEGRELNVKEYENIFTAIGAFQAGNVDSIITSTGTISLLDSSESFPEYSQNLKIILVNTIEEKIVEEKKAPSDKDRFAIYISGIDTFGSVTIKSRSDVNIIAVVNNETKQVLLVSTPRDYYIDLDGDKGKKDKLTHAGVFGIESSMDTLEGLYGQSIDHYVRMNFSGFKDIIDELGGIDVDSDYSFKAYTEDGTNVYISKGINHLDGHDALAFARERHSFSDGDRQRGRNQMKVIKATIEKMESSDMLLNYANVMESLSGSFQTDMAKDEIGYLVQSTIDDPNWEVLTYSVGGNDATKTCYSLGMEAYVMIPNEEDVSYGYDLMQRVLNGDKISQDEINVYIENKDAQDLINQDAVDQDPVPEEE